MFCSYALYMYMYYALYTINIPLSLVQYACLTCTTANCYLAPVHILLTLSTIAVYLIQSYTQNPSFFPQILCVCYPIQNPSFIDFYCGTVCVYFL